MEMFLRLLGSLLRLVYHCFDRIVICGYLPLLSRPEHIVYFFRDVHAAGAITKDVLRERTDDYNRWVESFARNHNIPLEWAEKASAKKITPDPPSGAGSARIASASTSSSRAWKSAPAFAPPRLCDPQDFRAFLRAGLAAFECRQSLTDLRLAGAEENQRQAANSLAEDRAGPSCVARLLQNRSAADISEVDNVLAGGGVEQPPEGFWSQQRAGELGRGAPETSRGHRPLRRLRSRIAPHADRLPSWSTGFSNHLATESDGGVTGSM